MDPKKELRWEKLHIHRLAREILQQREKGDFIAKVNILSGAVTAEKEENIGTAAVEDH